MNQHGLTMYNKKGVKNMKHVNVRVDENGTEVMTEKKGSVPVAKGKVKISELNIIAERLKDAEGTGNFSVIANEYLTDDTGIGYDSNTKTCFVKEGFKEVDGFIVRA